MPSETPAQVEPNSSAPAPVANGGLACITPKCGVRTTQLWLIVGVIALLAATVFADKLSAKVLALVAPAMAITYFLVREYIYRDAAAHPNNALDAILSTILSTIPQPDLRAVPALIAALKGASVAAPAAELSAAPAAPAVPPSSASSASSSSSTSGHASLSLLCALGLFAALLVGCGTPFGIGVADALESQANQKVIAAAVSFGVGSLVASLGGNVPPDLKTTISTAGGAVADGVAWGTVYAGAELLRTKQSTASSAKPGALTASLMQAGLPQDKATVVAQSVATLTQKGVPADVANEAVAATLDGAASAKAAQQKTGEGK